MVRIQQLGMNNFQKLFALSKQLVKRYIANYLTKTVTYGLVLMEKVLIDMMENYLPTLPLKMDCAIIM